MENEEDMREVFNRLDTDGSGLLDLWEFEDACIELGISNANIEQCFQIVSGIKRRKKWDDMDQETQLLWTALGWSQGLWDTDGRATTEELDWEDLFPSQKRAAENLGYTRYLWNTEGDGEDAIPFDKFKKAVLAQSGQDSFSTKLQLSEREKRMKIESIRSEVDNRGKDLRKDHSKIEAIRRMRMSNNTGGDALSFMSEPKISTNTFSSMAGDTSTSSYSTSKPVASTSSYKPKVKKSKKPVASSAGGETSQEKADRIRAIREKYGIK